MLTCSFCGKLFAAVNNGDDVSPCCNAQSIEGMSLTDLKEALIEAISLRAISKEAQ